MKHSTVLYKIKMKKIYLTCFWCFLVLACTTNQKESLATEIVKAANKKKFPKYIGCVSDFEKVFTDGEKASITTILEDYETKTTNEIAVISLDENVEKQNFDQYALDLSNAWGIGKAEKNNGLTIVFSKKLKQIRICTGTGTEKILNDKLCEKVLNEQILPEFRKDNYYTGSVNGINEFIKLWELQQ